MWSIAEEIAFREDLFQSVLNAAIRVDGTLSRSELGSFDYVGTKVRVIDSMGGIWNPGASWNLTDPLRATLSINTTNSGKYDDEEKSSGLWKYDYQTGGIGGKNNKLRAAMEFQLPVLWLVQQDNGRYIPYKVYVIQDSPADNYCLIAPDILLARAVFSESPIERRYAERLMKQRLHQPAFRAKVLGAYETKCAVCRLAHGNLLDAAHITADSEESSSTSVTNGLSLCKIHHASYDANLMGIDSNYVVHIKEALLAEKDGPMLEYGLQKMNQIRILIPHSKGHQPDRDRLLARFEVFFNENT
jgi:putative restriction endonuclease